MVKQGLKAKNSRSSIVIIILSVLLAAAVGALIFVLLHDGGSADGPNSQVVGDIYQDNTVFGSSDCNDDCKSRVYAYAQDYEDYQKIAKDYSTGFYGVFPTHAAADFEDHDYIYLKLYDTYCAVPDISVTLQDKTLSVKLDYEDTGVCQSKYRDYEIEIKDLSRYGQDFQVKKDIEVETHTGACGRMCDDVVKKPVMYLYPTADNTAVNITFDHADRLTTTYPKFENAWRVIADRDGTLTDAAGNHYYALYWEEQEDLDPDFTTGFYVTKENAAAFLEEKLTAMGLTYREKNEFIMYWLPVLEKNGRSIVNFEFTDALQANNAVHVEGADSLFRAHINIKKVSSKPTDLKPQSIEPADRSGFAVIEWGGSEF